MANILLLFLSQSQNKEVWYRYEKGDVSVVAAHPNTGTAKALNQWLEGGLNKVIYLASESVREKRNGESTADSFENSLKEMQIPDLISVDIPDNFDEAQIINYVIEMTKNVTEEDCVYIDFSGGIRQAAFALVAVCKILECKGVENIELLTSQYNRTVEYTADNPLVIKNNKSVSVGQDYVSATQYFLKTGDISELKNWFEGNEKLNPEETDILDAFMSFYESFALCRAKLITAEWENVQEMLKDYEGLEEKTVSFNNVVELFWAKIGKKDEVGLVKLLNWCVEHDLIQQALTLFNEMVPDKIAGMKKTTLLYSWPKKVENENKRSYLGIYGDLVDCSESWKREFKVYYLLLDSFRDYVNHASSDENANGINVFLEKIVEDGYFENNEGNLLGKSPDINDILSDSTKIKAILSNVIGKLNGFKDMFIN